MGLDSFKTLEDNQAELSFSISKEIFDGAVTRVYVKKAPRINVPGFRKGKAPRNIIEKMYGKGIFYEDALNELIPEYYDSALKESGAKAVSRPDFDVSSIDENGVAVKAKFYVKPEAQISDYKEIPVDKIVTPASESDVAAEIERMRERNARLIDITDRPAQNGDTAVITYEGTVGGETFEGGSGDDYELVLGSGSFIPGFEAQVEGHNIGDEFEVNVTFPDNYGEKTLAGKAAVFSTKLKAIKLKELPEADDEFAKDVSEFNTLDEYKADILAKINDRNEHAAEHAVEDKLFDAIIAKTEVSIPAPMIEAECENIIRDRDYNLRSRGLSLEMFLKYTNQTMEDVHAEAHPQAERNIKARLALEKIAVLEGIAADEADIEAEYQKLAKLYNMEVDKLKESVKPESLTDDIITGKALEFVKSSAVITVKTKAETETEEKTETKTEAEEKTGDSI